MIHKHIQKDLVYTLRPSSWYQKKWSITDPDKKTINFGQRGAMDFTMENMPLETREIQKKKYMVRHKKNENWTDIDNATGAFWSKNLLWNQPSLQESIKDVEKKYGIKIILKEY